MEPMGSRLWWSLVVATAVISVAATRELWDWRPVDLRRVVVTLREGVGLWAAVAVVAGVINSFPHRTNHVVVGRIPPRGQWHVVVHQVGASLWAMAAGSALPLSAVMVRAARQDVSLAQAVAVVAWMSSVVMITAVAHAVAILVAPPGNLLVTPVVVLILITGLVTLNETALANTGHSSLLASPTWGLLAPVGYWDFNTRTEALRIVLFMLTALAVSAAVVEMRSDDPPLKRAGWTAGYLMAPTALVVTATLMTPVLVVPRPGPGACQSKAGVMVCVHPSQVAATETIRQGAARIVAQLPARNTPIIVTQTHAHPTGIDIGSTLLLGRDAERDRISLEVAQAMAGLRSCPVIGSEEDADHVEAADMLSAVLLARAGMEPGRPIEGTNLATVGDAAFQRWWTQHERPIEECSLATAALQE